MIEFLYQALRADRGIVIRTDDVERLRQRLYAARREACDTSLDVLSFLPSVSAPDSELWIVKRGIP